MDPLGYNFDLFDPAIMELYCAPDGVNFGLPFEIGYPVFPDVYGLSRTPSLPPLQPSPGVDSEVEEISRKCFLEEERSPESLSSEFTPLTPADDDILSIFLPSPCAHDEQPSEVSHGLGAKSLKGRVRWTPGEKSKLERLAEEYFDTWIPNNT
ncbi:MAG: hypothetical protein ACQEP8_05270 [Chlamydiota bacterium]